MIDLPQPLTPADCDLAGYRWMPLDVERVIDSDTFGLSTGDEFKTAFRLWAKSWKQVPAASLPNDDKLLAHLAGLEPATWKKRKAVALRGWILCSDGRLYHPVIAQKAIEAMDKREAYVEREQNQETRQQRYRERRRELFAVLRGRGIVVSKEAKMDELERLVASLQASPSVTQSVTGDVTRDVTHDASATAKEKDRTGQDSKPKPLEEQSPAQTKVAPPADDCSSPVSRSVEIAVYLRQRGVVGANSMNPNIATWGDDARVTNEILDAAISKARASLTEGAQLGPNYLAPVVADLLNPKPAKPVVKRFDDWDRTQEGIKRKARELGFGDGRQRESWDELKARCWDEIKRREAQGAAA
ncbi:DUF1376 domain-containing protein [Trinickia soli]|uniref:DUF1376 domain-containing protein n=1 Tax=Trinickia soli TaxID=380675 RepID=A0A2N7VQ47_9BURK|nr:DUF1376 domain-containing protein [Trinickia soli]PMS19273.1 hypothetical protein C0Z19_21825 [Trinickia soli]CAB3644211.1 hypothetical protein LMG24076_00469 [Trinickia soli]